MKRDPIPSPFNWRSAEPSALVLDLQRQANQRAESARRVKAARDAGIPKGTIYGLSKKADRRREGQSS